MPAQILIVSTHGKDVEFGFELGKQNGLPVLSAQTASAVRSVLMENPQSVVLWNAEHVASARLIAPVLSQLSQPAKVFAVTQGPINQYPHLLSSPTFGHHLLRRYDSPSSLIYSRLLQAALTPQPFGLSRYFPAGTSLKSITLKSSPQKTAAVQAMQNHLTKQEVPPRLSALAAQAMDELLLNALFDAPVDAEGKRYRHALSRDASFELSTREQIEIQIGIHPEYVGISVADNFGSIDREAVRRFLNVDFQEKALVAETSAGLGLSGVIGAGMSIAFIGKPKSRTEVLLFFKDKNGYRGFRSGFRFVSVLLADS